MVDVGLAAVAVTATVFVMNKDGCPHRRRLLAEARCGLLAEARRRLARVLQRPGAWWPPPRHDDL